jgi:small-conductance mechanosensitive channel
MYREVLSYLFAQYPWLENIVRILIYYLSAGIAAFLLIRLVGPVLKLGRFSSKERRPSQERRQTLQGLVANAIKLLAFVIATILSLGLFIERDTLAWLVGLFSAAFGLGARPLISDYLGGVSFIFEDTFAVGEKIEILGSNPVEGVVESINLRATSFRAPSGELFVVPNGEIRTVRNFSRGKFSLATVKVKIPSSQLGTTVSLLEELGKEAVLLLPNLIEPWQVISPEGVIGQNTELSLVAKARFGMAAEMRPRLLNLVQARLEEADITLED